MTPSPHHPIGAKGVGESATVGSPAAYVNAVIDALAHRACATSTCPSCPTGCGPPSRRRGAPSRAPAAGTAGAVTPELLDAAAELARRREPFVLATVVWRRGPSSGKPGAAALVLPDGTVRGWLGGACAEPTVVRESLLALETGEPSLLVMGEADDRRVPPGAQSVPMACASEGALEVYLEPMLPPPHVVVIGRSPAVGTLASLARALGWAATIVDDGGSTADRPDDVTLVTTLDLSKVEVDPRTAVVVATQGHYDEDGAGGGARHRRRLHRPRGVAGTGGRGVPAARGSRRAARGHGSGDGARRPRPGRHRPRRDRGGRPRPVGGPPDGRRAARRGRRRPPTARPPGRSTRCAG